MAGNNSGAYVSDLVCSYLDTSKNCPYPNENELRIIRTICSAARSSNYLLFTIALVFGLPGSILALITLSRMSMKPSTIYLCLLAAADFISLVFISFSYHKILDLRYPNRWEDLSKWIGRLFQAVAHWLLVFIVLERFISIRFPFKKAILYTTRTVIWTTIAAVLLSSVPLVLYCLQKAQIITDRKIRSTTSFSTCLSTSSSP